MFLMMTLTAAIAVSGLSASGQQNKKAAEARKDITKGQKDLKEAKADSAADYQKFKKEAEIKIKENEKKIAELKTKNNEDNKEAKEKYDQKVAALERKNNEMKKRIEGSGSTKSSMWSAFKSEFNHDMDELGRAFGDIGVNNVK